MTQKRVLLGLVIVFLGLGVQSALAQKVEIHPYGGGIFPGEWRDSSSFKRDGIYGLKGGVFLADRFQLEGNLGYLNHFEFENTDPRSRAFIWEAGPSINFFSSTFSKAVPFLSIKAGGVTGFVGDPEDVADNSEDFANIAPVTSSPVILEDGDTFFQFSYGGGIKGLRLWGPLGLRAEVRGRTMPNFFGNSVTWLETTGGVTFSWGER
jgi:hypothetical protein